MSIIGMNMMTWTTTLDEKAFPYFHKAKDMGFDGVEIGVGGLVEADPKRIERVRTELDLLGLKRTCLGGLSAETNILDENESVREKGKRFMKRCIDVCYDLNATTLNGVFYTPFRVVRNSPRTKEEWKLAVAGLREAADYARPKGVTIGLEIINRYETYLMNTIEDALNLLKDIDRDNIKLHIDSYHMNIEETDFYTPVIKARGKVGHVHVSDNHRGIPGTGHINWDDFFRGLRDIDYHGWIVAVVFFAPIEGKLGLSSVMTYRNEVKNIDEIPRQSAKFMREKANQYGV